jgi:hypothetical protein
VQKGFRVDLVAIVPVHGREEGFPSSGSPDKGGPTQEIEAWRLQRSANIAKPLTEPLRKVLNGPLVKHCTAKLSV